LAKGRWWSRRTSSVPRRRSPTPDPGSPGSAAGDVAAADPAVGVRPQLKVEAHRLAAWRDDFLAAGKQGLKGQRADRTPDDRALKQAERKIGQLTMENEVLRAAAEKRGLQIPPAKRPR
jgi:hypothetical protein